MPRTRKAHLHKAPNEQQDYHAWKADAAKQLQQRHHVEATVVAERIWVQFYARRLEPSEAADRAEMVHRRARPVTAWLKKR